MKESLKRHKEKMMYIQNQIDTSYGYRKRDLIRQYKKMKKEYDTALRYMKGA